MQKLKIVKIQGGQGGVFWWWGYVCWKLDPHITPLLHVYLTV